MKNNGNEIIASLVNKHPIPLGLNEWNFQHDSCKGIKWLKMSSVSLSMLIFMNVSFEKASNSIYIISARRMNSLASQVNVSI